MVLGCGGLMKHYKLRRRVQEKGTMCPRYKAHSSCHQLSSPVALDAGEGAARRRWSHGARLNFA